LSWRHFPTVSPHLELTHTSTREWKALSSTMGTDVWRVINRPLAPQTTRAHHLLRDYIKFHVVACTPRHTPHDAASQPFHSKIKSKKNTSTSPESTGLFQPQSSLFTLLVKIHFTNEPLTAGMIRYLGHRSFGERRRAVYVSSVNVKQDRIKSEISAF